MDAVIKTATKGLTESYYEPDIWGRGTEREKMEKFAVIDTETNWNDEVMSIGIVIADTKTKEKIASEYYIIDPEYRVGGIYREMHNAVSDAEDELEIMRLLGHAISVYDIALLSAGENPVKSNRKRGEYC